MHRIKIAIVMLVAFIVTARAESWTIDGSKATDEFSVGRSSWKVKWDISKSGDTAYILIGVKDAKTGKLITMGSATAAGPGQLYVHTSGRFYLDIVCTGKGRVWTE